MAARHPPRPGHVVRRIVARKSPAIWGMRSAGSQVCPRPSASDRVRIAEACVSDRGLGIATAAFFSRSASAQSVSLSVCLSVCLRAWRPDRSRIAPDRRRIAGEGGGRGSSLHCMAWHGTCTRVKIKHLCPGTNAAPRGPIRPSTDALCTVLRTDSEFGNGRPQESVQTCARTQTGSKPPRRHLWTCPCSKSK